jgi:hypothetical protein
MITRRYTEDEVDGFGVYCLELDACYYLPASSGCERREMRLRLGPTKNNQAQGIRWAHDYEFTAKMSALLGP